MKCDCQDWKDNIDLVNGPIVLQAIRSGLPDSGYKGKKFIYCPWCAGPLVEELKPQPPPDSVPMRE